MIPTGRAMAARNPERCAKGSLVRLTMQATVGLIRCGPALPRRCSYWDRCCGGGGKWLHSMRLGEPSVGLCSPATATAAGADTICCADHSWVNPLWVLSPPSPPEPWPPGGSGEVACSGFNLVRVLILPQPQPPSWELMQPEVRGGAVLAMQQLPTPGPTQPFRQLATPYSPWHRLERRFPQRPWEISATPVGEQGEASRGPNWQSMCEGDPEEPGAATEPPPPFSSATPPQDQHQLQ